MSEKRYNTVSEIPDYAKVTITKLVDSGKLNGSGTKTDADDRTSNLDLSIDMIQLLVINDQAGLYGE